MQGSEPPTGHTVCRSLITHLDQQLRDDVDSPSPIKAWRT
jgi:hypothetical protein